MVYAMTSEVSTKCPQKSDFAFLPSKQDQNINKERVFRTAVPAGDYARLESEAAERGTTPFRLAGLIVSAYLDGKFMASD